MEDDHEEANTSSSSCRCFEFEQLRWFAWSKRRDETSVSLLVHHQLSEPEEARETWLMQKVKMKRHFTEVLASPKWKNFIRSFGSGGINKKRKPQFQYDLRSYELNFDDWTAREERSMHPRF